MKIAKTPSYPQKFLRHAGSRLRDPAWQRYGTLLLIGKASGFALMVVLAIIIFYLLVRAPGQRRTADRTIVRNRAEGKVARMPLGNSGNTSDR